MNDEIRRSLSIKIKPTIARKARVRAAHTDKRLAEWIEEAIGEKASREEREGGCTLYVEQECSK